jgi:hypothetical protein
MSSYISNTRLDSQFGRRYCRTSSPGFNSRTRSQEERLDLVWHVGISRCVPSGVVHEQHRVRCDGDMAADFVEIELHGVGVGPKQSERCAFCARRRHDTEEIGAYIVGQPIDGAATRVWPIIRRGRSSGRCAPRSGTSFRSEFRMAGRPDGRSTCAKSFLAG